MSNKFPNILFFGIDTLRRHHMCHYGYNRLTTPHISKYAQGGVTFDNCFSPHIPTSSGYANMLTGRDCFGTDVVALRHKGNLAEGVPVLAEILRQHGYTSTSVGFEHNVSAVGFDNYLHFAGWGPDHEDGRAHKAMNLNEVAIPEMDRLQATGKPWLLFLRHMDPHAPYLAPEPFQSMFLQGDYNDPKDKRMKTLFKFKPFGSFHKSWVPKGTTSPEYLVAQYDAAVAYMDTCIQQMLQKLNQMGLEEETIVIFTSDHGEHMYEHDCNFDHHGMYEGTLCIPLIIRWKGKLPEGKRYADYCQLKDIVPTLLDMADIKPFYKRKKLTFEGRSLLPLTKGEYRKPEPEFYITEATWMRKHGWRTPEWKLIVALEPDFHFKPEVELYNLITDPKELDNVADKNPEVVEMLKKRMQSFIEKREKETGRTNPMYTNLSWHGYGDDPFKTSQEAYDTLFIGGIEHAISLQEKKKR
jgi:arylsulfatase A-like enzyme